MKLSLALGGLAVLNVSASLLLQWTIVTRLGLGLSTDALFASAVVPQFALAIVYGSFTPVLIPILSVEDGPSFPKSAWSLFLITTGVFAAIVSLLFLLAPAWIPFIVPGFDGPATALTVSLTRIQLPGMLLTASTSVLFSASYARRRFVWAELSAFVTASLAVGAVYAALPRYGVAAAAWVSTGRALLHALLLLPALGRWPGFARSPAVLGETWRRVRPLLAGTLYFKLDSLVDRALSSMAPPGGLTTYYLAQQCWGAGTQILNKTIAAPVAPALSRFAQERRWREFERMCGTRLTAAVLLTVLPLLAVIAAGRPLLRLLIGHGGISAENVTLLWVILIALGGSVIAGVAGFISTAAFFALGDTRTPTRLGVASFTAYVPLKFMLFHYFGLIGMALSTSAFVAFNTVAQVFILRRRLRHRESGA